MRQQKDRSGHSKVFSLCMTNLAIPNVGQVIGTDISGGVLRDGAMRIC